jgi:hypothetical protein
MRKKKAANDLAALFDQACFRPADVDPACLKQALRRFNASC